MQIFKGHMILRYLQIGAIVAVLAFFAFKCCQASAYVDLTEPTIEIDRAIREQMDREGRNDAERESDRQERDTYEKMGGECNENTRVASDVYNNHPCNDVSGQKLKAFQGELTCLLYKYDFSLVVLNADTWEIFQPGMIVMHANGKTIGLVVNKSTRINIPEFEMDDDQEDDED